MLPESKVLEPKFVDQRELTPNRKTFLKQSAIKYKGVFHSNHIEGSIVDSLKTNIKIAPVKNTIKNSSLAKLSTNLNCSYVLKGKVYNKSEKINRPLLYKDFLSIENDDADLKSCFKSRSPQTEMNSSSFNRKDYFSSTPSPQKNYNNLVIKGLQNSFFTPKPSKTPQFYPSLQSKGCIKDRFLDRYESNIRLFKRIRKHQSGNQRNFSQISAIIKKKNQSTPTKPSK